MYLRNTLGTDTNWDCSVLSNSPAPKSLNALLLFGKFRFVVLCDFQGSDVLFTGLFHPNNHCRVPHMGYVHQIPPDQHYTGRCSCSTGLAGQSLGPLSCRIKMGKALENIIMNKQLAATQMSGCDNWHSAIIWKKCIQIRGNRETFGWHMSEVETRTACHERNSSLLLEHKVDMLTFYALLAELGIHKPQKWFCLPKPQSNNVT